MRQAIRRWLPTGLKLAISAVVLFLAALWVEHALPIELPVPTGPFAVSRWSAAWADEDKKRELLVWIWYPAAAGQSAALDDYLPAALRAEEDRTSGVLNSKFLTRDLSRVHAHSLRSADVSPQQRSYPVVIMR